MVVQARFLPPDHDDLPRQLCPQKWNSGRGLPKGECPKNGRFQNSRRKTTKEEDPKMKSVHRQFYDDDGFLGFSSSSESLSENELQLKNFICSKTPGTT
jgi:hypothetical protein